MTDRIWTVAEAKARFSELIEQARMEPQTITRHGRSVAVVVSAEEWEKKSNRSGNLAEIFANSTLRESQVDIRRHKDRPRQTDLQFPTRREHRLRAAAVANLGPCISTAESSLERR